VWMQIKTKFLRNLLISEKGKCVGSEVTKINYVKMMDVTSALEKVLQAQTKQNIGQIETQRHPEKYLKVLEINFGSNVELVITNSMAHFIMSLIVGALFVLAHQKNFVIMKIANFVSTNHLQFQTTQCIGQIKTQRPPEKYLKVLEINFGLIVQIVNIDLIPV